MEDIDFKRNEIINALVESSTKKDNPTEKVDFMKIKNVLESDLFEVLEKHGYDRKRVLPIVANMMINLTRLK